MGVKGDVEYRGYIIHHDGIHWVAEGAIPDEPVFQVAGADIIDVLVRIDELWDGLDRGNLPNWFDAATRPGIAARAVVVGWNAGTEPAVTSAPAEAFEQAVSPEGEMELLIRPKVTIEPASAEGIQIVQRRRMRDYAKVGLVPAAFLGGALTIPVAGPSIFLGMMATGLLAPKWVPRVFGPTG
jgi:hypothetical protein